MKKLILFLPFLFLFSQKIYGQVAPRLIKQVEQNYSNSLDLFLDNKQLLYEYDFRGNVISETEINFDEQGEIISWAGVEKQYDANQLLIKEINRRYNWDLGIWITNDWIEFFYDENDCLIERKIIPNMVTADVSTQMINHDNECKELGYIWENEDGSLVGEVETIYTDGGNRVESKIYFYVEILGALFYSGGLLTQVNEEKDTMEFFDFQLYSGGSFYQYTHSLFEYDYQYRTDGELHNKTRNTYSIVYPNNYNVHNSTMTLDTILSEIATTEYHYCKDVLTNEEIDYSNLNTPLGKRRILYFYEGEDACFDFENKSTAIIYPNPTSANLQIQSPLLASGNTQMRVIDINGKVLLNKSLISREEKIILDVSHLTNGTYFLQLLSGEHFVSEKIIILK